MPKTIYIKEAIPEIKRDLRNRKINNKGFIKYTQPTVYNKVFQIIKKVFLCLIKTIN